jgi:hypothetical protein
MKLSKYYQQATLYPFLITIALTIIYTVIENKDYKSEWLTAEAVTMMSIIYTILYCLFLNVLCLTIFLCKLEVVRNSQLLTFLSWFLLPLSPNVIIMLKDYRYYMDIGWSSARGDLLYMVCLNGPVIVGLIWSFISYKKGIRWS